MIYLDIFIVTLLFVFLIKNKELNILNGSVIYLFIHVFFVTFRGIQIYFLGANIVSNKWYEKYITIDEIGKAILISDLSLLAFFAGFYLFIQNFKVQGNLLNSKFVNYSEANNNIIKKYLAFIFIIGIFGVLTYQSIADRDLENGEYSTTSNFIASIGIVSSIMLIYYYGFRKYLVIYFFILVGFYFFKIPINSD